MRTEDFDYVLPEELIAQKPLKDRDTCRLMILNRADQSITHGVFTDLLEHLQPGDLLVMNDSRVIPARLYGVKKETGARIEFLLIKRLEGDDWETMVRPGRRLKPGDVVSFCAEEGKRLEAEITGYGEDGTRIVRFRYDGIFMERLEEQGMMPLPPYIERPANDEDREDYQTVYAEYDGSVAAPTAGLHFTEDLLVRIAAKGVRLAWVTLHVGIGTFRPVKVDRIEEHHMHFEEYEVSPEAAAAINETIRAGGRVVAVGTTSVRTLESAASYDEKSGLWLVKAGPGRTDIFIYPGYEFHIVKALVTNFHLPKSTLLMLISALYDRTHILAAYEEAVRERYRFFSYGDAMLIE
ncbi:MAG: tRNA preQ1(34) S-adenosylmethionine ribosyltransferase-isomerase QueA [Firmicutes bacterium]|nr:tRNA preQ1(34) S-adenosylmethionine ribosyltransferase-isomerase QueA [Bacillota bacterium]